MQKLFSIFLVICLIFVTLAPSVDANIRIRKGRLNQINNIYAPYYRLPYYQTQINNQITQVSQTSVGGTYYYSQNYIQGYTYYSTPTPGYYHYPSFSTYTNTITTTQVGGYYYSQNYIQGYTYYTTPTPGYYYYNTTFVNNSYVPPSTNSYNNNVICTIINSRYQCVANTNVYSATYPGCSSPDIIIGGQIWASCNALNRNEGSTTRSGWFFAGERESPFISYNGYDTALEWMGKRAGDQSWNIGPCATGYRLPTQGEWNTLQSYARAGNTTITSLLSLKQNGSYLGARNTNGDIVITGRLSVTAAYWSSSIDGGVPLVMHIGSNYQGYNTTGTDYGYVNNGYQWTYTDTGLILLRSTTGELANVRCIKQ